MTFKIVRPSTIKWPVEVHSPADGGKFVKRIFEAEFRYDSKAEIDDIGSRLGSGDLTAEAALQHVVIGWSGIADADGAEVPFSPSALNQAMEMDGVTDAMLRAYVTAVRGAAGRQKN